MRLAIVVHPEVISQYAGLPHARETAKAIDRLGATHELLQIPTALPPTYLHERLPPPSSDLDVFVCGAYREVCVEQQAGMLREKGYAPEIYEQGSLRLSAVEDRRTAWDVVRA